MFQPMGPDSGVVDDRCHVTLRSCGLWVVVGPLEFNCHISALHPGCDGPSLGDSCQKYGYCRAISVHGDFPW
jgi:hypothetical protein